MTQSRRLYGVPEARVPHSSGHPEGWGTLRGALPSLETGDAREQRVCQARSGLATVTKEKVWLGQLQFG